MGEMDQGVKRLLETRPADLLHLALPEAVYEDMLPTEVATEPQLTLDALLRVRYHEVECAVDIEIEGKARPNIGERLFHYAARAMRLKGLPVFSVVLWMEPGGAPVPSPHVIRVDDRVLGDWYFTGIEVYRLRAEDVLAQGAIGLLPLIPFTEGGASEATLEAAARRIHEQTSGSELQTLETLLAVFGARYVDADVMLAIWRKLSMSTELIEGSSLYQLWVAKGREEGREKGREEGREEGERAALHDGVRLALISRFGALPDDITQALEQADVTQLRDVLAHIGGDTLEQARARLGVA